MTNGFDNSRHFIGVISDTHGLLRPEAIAALRGVELILHAGDVHNPFVLSELEQIAPVIAVRGNHDKGNWARDLHEIETIKIGAISICMIHDLKALEQCRTISKFHVIISGHSHKPVSETRDGVLYLNPGSAGPRRFKLPVTLALMRIAGEDVNVEIVELLNEEVQPNETQSSANLTTRREK